MTCPAHDLDLSEPCTCDPQRIRDRLAREAAKARSRSGVGEGQSSTHEGEAVTEHPYRRIADDFESALHKVNEAMKASGITMNELIVAWGMSDPNPFPHFSLFRRTRK